MPDQATETVAMPGSRVCPRCTAGNHQHDRDNDDNTVECGWQAVPGDVEAVCCCTVGVHPSALCPSCGQVPWNDPASGDPHQCDVTTTATEIDDIIAALIVERQRQGLSQRDVTRKLGTSSAQMSMWERGINSPTLTNLRGWARALGLNLTLTTVDAPTCTCGAVEYGPLAQHLAPCPLRAAAEGGRGRG